MALRDVPSNFKPENEEELRIAVSRYFYELGFDANEIRFESEYKIILGHNAVMIGRKPASVGAIIRGRSDLLLTRNGTNIAIVETKAVEHSLNEEDAEQAISYARLLRQIAPYAIVTNGKETRVYDTLAFDLVPIDDPTHSIWFRNNQSIPSISEDIKFNAARILIGINPVTLRSFCTNQMQISLQTLKGSVREGGLYIPDVYTERTEIDVVFDKWLSTTSPCFAVVGESGSGKTNFMCATAEKLSESYFVLFYTARNLSSEGGILAAIRDDFTWEFYQDRPPTYIFTRFDEIGRKHNQELIIFIDGLDEFAGNYQILKSQLLNLSTRLSGTKVRICVSCKSFDWDDFVIEQGQYYSPFAKSIYPVSNSVHQPQSYEKPSAINVGYWLSSFTTSELEQAFIKYKKLFLVEGELQGETLLECKFPLMLRLISEAYRGKNGKIPNQISGQEVFDLYWERRLNTIPRNLRIFAEEFLVKLSTALVENNKRQIELSDLRTNLVWNEAVNDTFSHLVRLGLVLLSEDERGFKWLSFSFEKLRSYVYTVRALKWLSQDPSKSAKQVCQAMSTALGLEAIEFFFTNIDRGETSILTEVALHSFNSFSQLIHSLEFHSSVTDDIPSRKQADIYLHRLDEFAIAYTKITNRYIPGLRERIIPYSNDHIGVWVSQDLNIYQLRVCTQTYPQTVLILAPELVSAILSGKLPADIRDQIRPVGTRYIGRNDIVKNLPQKAAWNLIEVELAKLIESRLLDESKTSILLQERIEDTLAYEPSIWVQGESDAHKRYCELLGYQALQDMMSMPLDQLQAQVLELIQSYISKLEISYMRGYELKLREVIRIHYWLEQLQSLEKTLQPPVISLDELYDCFEGTNANSQNTAKCIEQLFSHVLMAYDSLVTNNFPEIASYFTLHTLLGSPILTEVIMIPGQFPEVTFVVLPSCTHLAKKYIVLVNRRESVFSQIQRIRKTIRGEVISMGGFGVGTISLQVDGLRIDEPKAVLYPTRLFFRQPIKELVYQIISMEAENIFGNSSHWVNSMHGGNENELDLWIARHYAKRSS